MICMYEATMDNLIRAFMRVANYLSWLGGGSIGKDFDSMSLKLEVVAKCGDPKVLVDAMKSYLRAEDLNTGDCALEGSKLFGSTTRSRLQFTSN